MRPQVVTQTGVGATAWIPVDRVQKPTNISLTLKVGGTANGNIEFTTDDVFDASVTPVAFVVTGMQSVSANTASNIVVPVQAVRANVTSGTGTFTLTILQGS